MGKDSRPLLVLAAGGTGGHVFPAQALAEEMIARSWRVELWTDQRGLRFVSDFPEQVSTRPLASATFSGSGVAGKALSAAKIIRGIASSLLRHWTDRPAAVAGFGGYASFPPVFAATLARIPSLVHEQNGTLGRANRVLARRVSLVACGIEATSVPAGARQRHTGNPLRADVLANSDIPYTPPNGIINLVVAGGSQAAQLLDDLVPRAVAKLPAEVRERLSVLQQIRSESGEVRGRYAKIGVEVETRAFISDLPGRVARAQIVISRSGASSVAELCAIGRPSILIPYAAAANREQSANAMALAAKSAAVAVDEADATPDRLASEMMAIISNSHRAAAMAAAAKSLAVLDAARRLGDVVEEVARKAA